MNKSFKVVFNKARGALMVVNEVTSSVQAKGTKTVIAAAVATLMAGAVSANEIPKTINNSNLSSVAGFGSALIAGEGNKLNIQTNGSVGTFIQQLENVKNANGIDKIGAIIALINPTEEHAGVFVATGGTNSFDLGAIISSTTPGTGPVIALNEGNTEIQIGSINKSSNPLVIGAVGGDLFLSNDHGSTIDRNGSSSITVSSGNTAGVVGGSAGILIGSSQQGKDVSGKVSKTSIDATSLTFNGSANVGGFIGGSVSVATNQSNVEGIVKKGTHIVIDMNDDADPGKLDGIVIGGFGGGLAVAGGHSTSKVTTSGKTLIEINNAEALGIIGGGAAVSIDRSGQGFLAQLIGDGSGVSEANSGYIEIVLGEKSATAVVMGGGVAFADASQKNVGESNASAKSVTLTLEGKSALTVEEKSKLHNAAYEFLKKVKDPGTSVGIKDFAEFAGGVNVDGAHVGNLGGGLAFARGYFEDTTNVGKGSAIANSNVTNVTMNLNGGYNVATAAGGLAIGLDKGGNAGKESAQTMATSNVETAEVYIRGGENILVTAGGISFATANSGENSHVKADAQVKTANVFVTGGSVDGLFGGGIAIDDTGAKITNAIASANNVTLAVTGGEVNVANMDPITGQIVGVKNGTPSKGSYVYQTAKLVEHANAAIVGGGLATGGGAQANVNEASNILLQGGKVNGNVVAGGAATLGGSATVTTANVVVNGATVNGDIYGGGLAGSPDNDAFAESYQKPTSHVENANINLVSGTLNGNVYLGGLVYNGNKAGATSTVKNGKVVLNGAFDFQGEKIDGSGAGKATLEIYGDVDLAKKTETAALFADQKNVVIGGFDNINGENGSLKNADFEFGNKDNTTITGGQLDFGKVIDGSDKKTMTLEGNAAVAITGDAANSFVVTNGVLGLGTDATTKDAAHAKGNYAGDAALYLSGTVHLDGKNITVGKTEQTGVAIGKNGMLIVDAGLEKGETANKDVVTKVEDGRITADGGKLHYVNVAEQGLVQIAGTDKMEATVDNVLFEIVNTQDSEGNAAIGFAVVKDQGKLDNLGLGDFNTDALHQIAGQKDEASEFINGFMNGQTGVALSGADRNAKLKSAFNLGAAAGVQTAGIDSALMGIDEATKRASLTNVFNDGWTGFASVTGNQLEFGDSSDALETKTKLAGVAVGGEYTMGDMTFGALGHFGSGDVKGQGRNSGVKNDVDYYGFQAYAAKRINQFNVVGQLGYVMTKNDITHDVGQSTKVDADVFTMGVRGEMNYAINDTWNAVPYVGLNWLRVSTDAYTTNKGIRVDSTDQDLINMPIGVAISGDCSNVAGWTVRPVVDVAYVHTFGDTDLDATSHVGEAAMGTTLDVWSENVGRFSVGAEARNGNMGFGFKLGGAKGDGGHEEFFGQLNAKYVF